MKRALEITTFKLNKSFVFKDFIKVNIEIDAWLKTQAGFQSRQIGIRKDGTVVDLLVWESVAKGTKAMSKLMKVFADSPIHSMISQQTVDWTITPINHLLEASI